MTRIIAVAAGLVLIAIAFIAAGSVADSRQGLVAEIVTLLSGLAGAGVLLYGLVPRRPPSAQAVRTVPSRKEQPSSRTANDLLVGGSGLAIAAILVGGLLWSAGWEMAVVGGVLLLPMIAGCGYLVVVFTRDRRRVWRIDLRRLTSLR